MSNQFVEDKANAVAGTGDFSFGDSLDLVDELAGLVLAEVKRATCWAASDGMQTEVGKRMVMLGGSGHPLAVTETIELRSVGSTRSMRPSHMKRVKATEAWHTGGLRISNILAA